jgi:hypothetical protein
MEHALAWWWWKHHVTYRLKKRAKSLNFANPHMVIHRIPSDDTLENFGLSLGCLFVIEILNC